LYGAGTGGLTADKYFIVVSPVNYGVRLQNQLESLLEEAHIKLSSLVSDLLGVSAQRMLKALSEGETNPAALAALADQHLRAPHRNNYVMRSVRARTSSPCTDDS
jgi:hypothetical protein